MHTLHEDLHVSAQISSIIHQIFIRDRCFEQKLYIEMKQVLCVYTLSVSVTRFEVTEVSQHVLNFSYAVSFSGNSVDVDIYVGHLSSTQT